MAEDSRDVSAIEHSLVRTLIFNGDADIRTHAQVYTFPSLADRIGRDGKRAGALLTGPVDTREIRRAFHNLVELGWLTASRPDKGRGRAYRMRLSAPFPNHTQPSWPLAYSTIKYLSLTPSLIGPTLEKTYCYLAWALDGHGHRTATRSEWADILGIAPNTVPVHLQALADAQVGITLDKQLNTKGTKRGAIYRVTAHSASSSHELVKSESTDIEGYFDINDYEEYLRGLKARIRAAQANANRAINTELILLYWSIGCDILIRQSQQGWGTSVIKRLAADLRVSFPNSGGGFSQRNLEYMRRFAKLWPDEAFAQTLSAQINWSSHQLLMNVFADNKELYLWYTTKSSQEGWSVRQLQAQIDLELHNHLGTAQSNLMQVMPPEEARAFQALTKDEYFLEFLVVLR